MVRNSMVFRSARRLFIAVALLGSLTGATDLHESLFQWQAQPAGASVVHFAIHHPMRSRYEARDLAGWLARAGYDVAGINLARQTVDVVTSESGVAFLQSKGLTGDILARHTRGTARNSRTDTATTDPANRIDARYLNPERLEAKLRALNQAYPQLTRLEQIGKSLRGRPIWALLVSTTPQAGDPRAADKPSILFDGTHHAREIMTPEIVTDVAETLLASVKNSPKAQGLVDRWNIWVVPMLNVDGNAIVWTSDAMWRKNARGSGGDGAYGVDINRNYPYRWAACNGSSNGTSAEDYHGASAASEPETQALMGLANRIRPAASLSYHSYSELVLYPFGCDGDVTGENALEQKVGQELAHLLPSDSARGDFYTPGTPWQILYSVDGDSMAYMFSEFGALSYTFEVNQEFQPSYDLRAPTLAKHRKAWAYFLDRIDHNLLTVKVIDARTGHPAVAQIAVNTIPHAKGEKPFQTNAGGSWFKVLDPGAYMVSVHLADGRQATTGVTMNGAPQAATVTVP